MLQAFAALALMVGLVAMMVAPGVIMFWMGVGQDD